MFRALHLRRSALVESCSERDMLTRIGGRSEPFGRHSFPRPKHTNSLRRTTDILNWDDRWKGERLNERIGAQVGADAPDRSWSDRGRKKVDDAATTPASNQPRKDPPIPEMSPMPVPETEEPSSDSGSANQGQEAIEIDRRCPGNITLRAVSAFRHLLPFDVSLERSVELA
jgi:hypothetical protein